MSLKGQVIDIYKKTVNSSVSNAINAAENLGSAALHTLIPDDYEYYMCSLELIDCKRNQIGFLSFSVMPNNISESKIPIQSQTKTKNGIVTLFNDSFCPITISLQGTFGRKFRILTDIVSPDNKMNFFNINSGKLLGGKTSISVKTGYGMIKVLKFILDKTNELDKDGNPYLLIYKNYSFNTAYVVDLINYNFNQGIENNMIWFYDLQLKAVAPAEAVRSKKQSNSELLKTVASNSIAQGLSNLINDVTRNNLLSY